MTVDSEFMLKILWTIGGAIATALLGLIVWGLKELIKAFFANTVQLKLINQHIAELLKLPPQVEKLKQDMNVAHERIRQITKNGVTKCEQ